MKTHLDIVKKILSEEKKEPQELSPKQLWVKQVAQDKNVSNVNERKKG